MVVNIYIYIFYPAMPMPICLLCLENVGKVLNSKHSYTHILKT